jgi:hyperosmotically inducible protein
MNKLIPLCAVGLLALNGCRALEDDVTVGEAIDDASITAQVKTAIAADDQLSAMEINVDTADGVVTLNGEVGERADIARATEVANDVEGVRSIRNNLTLDQN